MKKLTAVLAVGVVAASAYASAENTVTLKRDVLGRAIGADQKQPVLLKNATVQKTAEPLAATSTSKVYSSMKDVYKDNPFNDGSDNIETVYGAFVSKGMLARPGYSEQYYLYDKGNAVSKKSYESDVNSIEQRYRSYYRNYVAPKVAIPSSFTLYPPAPTYSVRASNTAPYGSEYYGYHYGYYLNIEHAHANTGVGLYAHNNAAYGYNANVFAFDKGNTYSGLQNKMNGYTCSKSSSHDAETRIRTTRRAGTVSHVAPEALVYVYDEGCYEDQKRFAVLPENPENKNLAVGLMNASAYKNNTGNLNIYGEESAILDDYIYYNRVVGVAPMEMANNNAAALNAITVGAIKPMQKKVFYPSISNPTFSASGTNFIKPEISGYGYLYIDQDKTYDIYSGNTNLSVGDPYVPTAYGSEVAAAYTAGLVSDLISLNSFYRWHPEVVKALLLTTATDASDANIIKYAYEKDCRVSNDAGDIGMGLPQFDEMITNNRSRYWMGKNSSHFSNSNTIEFTESGITKGRRYRIAIAWLMRGDNMISRNTVHQDIDLKVITKDEMGNRVEYKSESSMNGYEMVDFEAKSSDDIQIVIKRYRNDGGRVLLGYNLHESW
ncbi:Subtilase family protein [Fibrobacter sp. UWH9]|uniref:S8 family serine peptidase n=1 Tax=unclassified Fibrobacter TaxID=2634177 RepID=UPI000918ED1B|nr:MULTISPECIES: S8 family serine peptidase [unclassified Fibrobacter]OWV05169.1 hypothetical protein B7993_09455 [Fibrobacter sp. UWH3]SHH16006.1 Subtilase family protein [Fibrobacter sp. UWH9]